MTTHQLVNAPIIETHELGMGLTATVIYEYVPAKEAPVSGCDWPECDDLPRVYAVLALPEEDGRLMLDPRLRRDTRVLGEPLRDVWGTVLPESILEKNTKTKLEGTKVWTDSRVRGQISRIGSLSASLADARAKMAVELETVRGVVAAREIRLAQRDATIARAISE
jgi:hypothetical protein